MKRFFIGWMTIGCAVFSGLGLPIPCYSQGTVASETVSCASFAERLQAVYQWPLDQGMATFSARLHSPAIEQLCQSHQISEPEITLEYLGWELSDIETRFATGTPVMIREALTTIAESVRNTAEGFFQNYETLAMRNHLHGISASATCRFDGASWIIRYPDRAPGQVITLEYDAQLKLVAQIAEDAGKGLMIRQQPTWTRVDGRHLLTGGTIEFFNAGVSVFRSTTTIENLPISSFHLPGRVRLEVRDGPVEQAGRALIEFRCSDYRLGVAHR